MTDERDPQVSGRYRELGTEEPPRALDDVILSAARQAVDKPHAPLVTPVGRHRWYYGVAAAAVVVLAVAVTMHVERQQPDEAHMPPVSAQVESAPQAKTPPIETQSRVQTAPPKPSAQTARRAAPSKPKPEFTPEPPPPAGAPAPQPEVARVPELASGRAAADAMMENRTRAEAAPAPMAKPAPAPPAAPQRAPARAAIEQSAETPEQQLERIAELRRQEKHEEADRALAEFRRRYPDYLIAPALRERVERN